MQNACKNVKTMQKTQNMQNHFSICRVCVRTKICQICCMHAKYAKEYAQNMQRI